LGNTVSPDRELGKLTLRKVTFVPGSDKASGDLVFEFEDNKKLTYHSVLTEDVYAAHRMVYTAVEGAPKWTTGDGIGLVGIEAPGRKDFLDFGPAGVCVCRVSEVVLLPALVDLDLGNAVIICDATPRSGRGMLYKAVQKSSGPEAAAEVNRVFQPRARSLA